MQVVCVRVRCVLVVCVVCVCVLSQLKVEVFFFDAEEPWVVGHSPL